MPSVYFFAARDDIINLLRFVFTETDCRVFEAYSAFDQELVEFRSIDHVLDHYDLGTDPFGNGCAHFIQLWSPSVMGKLQIERIALIPSTGHSFRFVVRGWGLISLQFGGLYQNVLTNSYAGWLSEASARLNAEAGLTDTACTDVHQQCKLGNKLTYRIRSKHAVAKAGTFPVLKAAYQHHLAGFQLKQSAKQNWTFDVRPL